MKEAIRFIKQFVISLVVFAFFVIALLGGLTNLLNPLFQMIADPIAMALRVPGDALRQVAMMVPMWMAKGFFLLYYILVVIWVWVMKKERTVHPLPGREKPFDLRPLATVSMVCLIIITILL